MNTPSITSTNSSFWPYAIAGYFAIAITGIVVFITWATHQSMDLVRADYYEREILFQDQIDAVNRTRPFAGKLGAVYDLDRRTLLVSVPAAHLESQFSGEAHLYRPSNAKLDQRVDLRPAPDGKQMINAANLAPGLWKIRLNWKANGEAFEFEQTFIVGG